MIKRVLIPLVLLASLFMVAYWLMQSGTSDNQTNIDFIKSKVYNNKIIDMQNEISVRTTDDIKWYYDKNDTIVIEYGKILLKFKINDFIKPEVQDELNKIFISVKQHPETLEFKLYFRDKELKEYVKK